MSDMKRVTFGNARVIHIETELGIINIQRGLIDTEGRRVESIQIIPDRYVGEKHVRLYGKHNNRLVELKKVRGE